MRSMFWGDSFVLRFNDSRFTLYLYWILGLFLGIITAMVGVSMWPSEITVYFGRRVSFSRLLIIRFVPLLLSVLLVCSNRKVFIVSAVLLRAYFYSFAGATFVFSLGISRWLLYVLSFFGDILAVITCWVLWLRSCYADNRLLISRCFLVAAFFALFVTLLEYKFVFPHMDKLL